MNYWKTLKSQLLKDGPTRADYDALAPEYELAAQIIGLRIAQNLTQSELASRAGLKQAAVARLESGKGNPTYETLYRISRALGKPVRIG